MGSPIAGDKMLLVTSSRRELQAALQWSAAREPPSGRRRSRRCKPHKPAGAAESPCLQSRQAQTPGYQAVQCWRTVQKHRVLTNDLCENIPNLRRFALHHLLGSFDGSGQTSASSLPKMKGLNSSNAIFLGRPHWCSLSVGPPRSRIDRSSPRAYPASSDGNDPACL